MKPPVDVEAVMARLNGDRELLGEIVALYLEDEGPQLERLEAALARGDAEEVRRGAHAIKGSVGNFSAERAQAAALALETAGRDGDLSNASALVENLRVELAAVRSELAGLVPTHPSCASRGAGSP